MTQCIISNPSCTPSPCANCQRVFCAHEHEKMEDRRAYGYYGQYCSDACRDAKNQQIWAIGRGHFKASSVILIVEQDYCYLVFDRCKANGHRGYGFKILHESAKSPEKETGLDYCHYPGFSMEDHPVTYAMYPRLAVAIAVYNEDDRSMWTIVGFRLLDGEIDTFGVGGHIEVIDLRADRQYALWKRGGVA